MTRALILAALLAGASGANAATTQCTTRPAVGGGTITTCRGVRGELAQQPFRTRPAVGGGVITTGGGRTCTTRRATGGGTATTCRDTP